MDLKRILISVFGIWMFVGLIACDTATDDGLDGSKTEESRLEMPNAFSPNGDGINDVYKAKSNYRAIVTFEATIFNRWGQKLYQWKELTGGWDGRFHGRNVSEGVYFVVVKARGADGKNFEIRQDVNLIRSITEHSGSTTK